MQADFNFFFYKGRVALYAILKSIDIKKGDEVIVPGFTCVAVPNAVAYLGARPVYADIDPGTYNISPGFIAKRINARTRAIIAQHTFGIPADMDPLATLARKHNIPVIEDSCHAIGSRYKGREVGSFGDAAFFSSQWSKPATTGLGGWAKVNNSSSLQDLKTFYEPLPRPSIMESFFLRALYLMHENFLTPSIFWMARKIYRELSKRGLVIGSSTNEELSYEMPSAYAKKMSDWQINLLFKKLNSIASVIEHRKWVVSKYETLLPQAGLSPLRLPNYMEPVFLRYPVSVADKKGILESARRNRIEMGDWFVSPVHPNLSNWEKIGYKKGMCPNAEKACEQTINLPTHPRIGIREIEKNVSFLKKFR
ncbi:MAG: DegT/DnrJ/EryC1/StrS family aminotransferase [Actinomycetota bacterium]|nr:DegT/DnrJ/EryC1/StrS family aminotransferase [Actinomycetota bacterium]